VFGHRVPEVVGPGAHRSRDVELAFVGLIPQRVSATQLLYRTTDMDGRPEVTVTTVLLPTERASENPCRLVSYQCAIDAVTPRYLPSYALRRGARGGFVGTVRVGVDGRSRCPRLDRVGARPRRH